MMTQGARSKTCNLQRIPDYSSRGAIKHAHVWNSRAQAGTTLHAACFAIKGSRRTCGTVLCAFLFPMAASSCNIPLTSMHQHRLLGHMTGVDPIYVRNAVADEGYSCIVATPCRLFTDTTHTARCLLTPLLARLTRHAMLQEAVYTAYWQEYVQCERSFPAAAPKHTV